MLFFMQYIDHYCCYLYNWLIILDHRMLALNLMVAAAADDDIDDNDDDDDDDDDDKNDF